MTSILDRLNADHGNVAGLMDLIEQQVGGLRRDGVFDARLLVQIMRYLTQYQDVFHHPREDALFARLLKRSPEVSTELAALEVEHESLGARGALLYREVRGCVKSFSASLVLADGFDDYASALRNHMRIESETIFPLARVVLSHRDWREVDEAIENRDDPLFGVALEESYHIVFRRLRGSNAPAGHGPSRRKLQCR